MGLIEKGSRKRRRVSGCRTRGVDGVEISAADDSEGEQGSAKVAEGGRTCLDSRILIASVAVKYR